MRLPLTLRVAYYGIRFGLFAAFLVIAGWVALVPATAEEQAALNASSTVSRPLGLTQMRTAKVIMAVAPDQFYIMAAQVMGPDVSPILLRAAVAYTAAGALPPGLNQQQQPQTSRDSARSIDGPRFIQVD